MANTTEDDYINELNEKYKIVTQNGYNRYMVSKFLVFYPGDLENISNYANVSVYTLKKLQSDLQNMEINAKKVWELIKLDFGKIMDYCDLNTCETDEIKDFINNLVIHDFSDMQIYTNEIYESLKEEYPHISIYSIDSIMKNIKIMSGTYIKLNLSNNFLKSSDIVVDLMIEILKDQKQLKELDLSKNNLTQPEKFNKLLEYLPNLKINVENQFPDRWNNFNPKQNKK